jgi:hypothetical protein
VRHFILLPVALLASTAALAQTVVRTQAAPTQTAAGGVGVSVEILAVKVITDAKGTKRNTLVAPTSVLPGTPLVISVTYKNGGARAATGFVINNPVSKGVTFTGVAETWAVVSIDGGKTFGALTALKGKNADGTSRAAVPQDVTAIRWTIPQPIAPGASGKVSFYAVVR